MWTLLRSTAALLCTLCLLWLTPTEANALDRCKSLAHRVKISHQQYFGVDFPYHYSVGQLQQESNCKDVISRDGVGSEGPGQITYRLWADALKKQGIAEVKTTRNNLRAQAYINYAAHKQNPHKKLWVTYQIYNGGGLVIKEISRAGKLDWALAKAACRRKIVHFKGGYSESACDINYDYSKRIFKYGVTYKVLEDPRIYTFW